MAILAALKPSGDGYPCGTLVLTMLERHEAELIKEADMISLFKQHLRLKRPCANCPFLKQGAIELTPGRLEGVIGGLIEDDHSTFQCHKTVHSARGGEWDDEGNYTPSGHESMCAGAAAYLMKHKRPTVGMRIAFATGAAAPTDWDDAQAMIID